MNKDLLPEELKDVLTEDSVSNIETALKEKVDLSVEAALTTQDELYAEKLEELVARIDSDHTAKMERVVESVDANNAKKLVTVVRKYERELNENATEFKDVLVESISSYIEEYIDEALPVQAIEEATANKTALSVLNNLRNVLAVDSSLMSESVKEAIVDGKGQINDLQKEFDVIKLENKHLKEAYEDAAARLVLDQKLSGFNDKKAAYLKKVLSDKTAKFITEKLSL